MKYTVEEVEFLKENYPKYGGKYCQPFLKNRKIDTINAMARRLKLSAKNKAVHPDLQKININHFLDIKTKEVAYFLGYFWADGHIHHYISNNINNWRIAFEIISEDANDIMPIMNFIGKWSKQIRKRKENWKETTTFVTNNKDLYNFLKENGYNDKSDVESTLILEKIPENLKKYFWKGYFDGDGSCNVIGRSSHFDLYSTYNYLFLEVKNWFNSLGINTYRHYKTIDKKGHKSSTLKLYGKPILKIIDYLPSYGLERKNKKLNQIKEYYANKSINTKGFL